MRLGEDENPTEYQGSIVQNENKTQPMYWPITMISQATLNKPNVLCHIEEPNAKK